LKHGKWLFEYSADNSKFNFVFSRMKHPVPPPRPANRMQHWLWFCLCVLLGLGVAAPLQAHNVDLALTQFHVPDMVPVEQGLALEIEIQNVQALRVYQIPVSWRVDNGPINTSVITLADGLRSGDMIRYTLPDSLRLTVAGSYGLTVWIGPSDPFDDHPENDTLRAQVLALADWVPRRHLAERWTGTWSGNCPAADPQAFALRRLPPPAEVFVVNVHVSDPLALPDVVRFFQDTLRAAATPRLMLNRFSYRPFAWLFPERWIDFAQVARRGVTYADLRLEASLAPSSDSLRATLDLRLLADLPGDYRLNAYVIQFGIPAVDDLAQTNYRAFDATNPYFGRGDPISEYYHDFAARALLGGASGVPWAGSGLPNTQVPWLHTFTWPLPPDADPNRLAVVAFVERLGPDSGQRSILNAAYVALGDDTPTNIAQSQLRVPNVVTLKLSPNPATDWLTLELGGDDPGEFTTGIVRLEAFSLSGQRVEFAQWDIGHSASYRLRVADWPAGLYRLRLTLPDGQLLGRTFIRP
jgi:hypothetical protein